MTAMRLPDPGDRIIDFTRPGPDGAPVGLYEARCGTPTILIAGAAGAVATALAAISGTGIPADAVVAVAGDPPTNATGPVTWVVDGDGAVGQALGADRAAGAVWLVLAPTLHVARRGPVAGPWLEDVATAYGAVAIVASPSDVTVGGVAPVLVLPAVLEPDLCGSLIDAFEAGGHAESGMPRMVDGQVRLVPDADAKVRRDLTLPDGPLNAAVVDRLARRVLPEIAKAFFYPVTRFEALKLVRYDGERAGHFRAHRDNTTPDAAHRRFALTINLNTGDYDGGTLVFPEFGPGAYAPPAGGAIVFSCSHLHAVHPVTRGRRYALISFLYGDRDSRRAGGRGY